MIEEYPLTRLYPFLIERVISSKVNSQTVKKIRSGNLLVEVYYKKHAELLIKMKTFHNLKSLTPQRSYQKQGVIHSYTRRNKKS